MTCTHGQQSPAKSHFSDSSRSVFWLDLPEMFFAGVVEQPRQRMAEITVNFLLDKNIISEIRKRDRANARLPDGLLEAPVMEMGTSVIVPRQMHRGIELKRRSDPEQASSLDRWFAQMRSRLGDRVLWPGREVG